MLALKVFLLALGCAGLLWSGRKYGARFLKHLFEKRNPEYVDHRDCYFDKQCHAKVRWEEISAMKGGFFQQLKGFKETKGAGSVKDLLLKAHTTFAKAGMPEDRIDYILNKWVELAFPEALDGLVGNASVMISGFSCANGYGKDVNQQYVYQGQTKDGRPYYRGSASPERFVYYDKRCADDTQDPRWLLGQEPDILRDLDLNTHDGHGCFNDFGIATASRHLPAGPQKLTWEWCGDHGVSSGATISIEYKTANPNEACNKYKADGMLALKGCHECATWYPGQSDKCMGCGKQCSEYCPVGSDFKCYQGEEFVQCHMKCMTHSVKPGNSPNGKDLAHIVV